MLIVHGERRFVNPNSELQEAKTKIFLCSFTRLPIPTHPRAQKRIGILQRFPRLVRRIRHVEQLLRGALVLHGHAAILHVFQRLGRILQNVAVLLQRRRVLTFA